jgi:protein pelota
MKILMKNLKKGLVRLVPTTLEDLWHIYNLIYKGDRIKAKTTREVKIDSQYSRPQKGKRVSVNLILRVQHVDWDRTLSRLRVHGEVDQTMNKIVGRGSHHTINVSLNKPLTIIKESWLHHHIERLSRATKQRTPPIIVVAIDGEEYCIAKLSDYGIDVKANGRAKLPSKLEGNKREKALQRLFRKATASLMQIWQQNRPTIVIIGVGFVKGQFRDFLSSEAAEITESIAYVRSVNSPGLAGIKEALRSGVLGKALKSLRIAREAEAVEGVLERLGRERRDVTYGLEEVDHAASLGAIESLLVADSSIRDAEEEERHRIDGLMKQVEENRGTVIVVATEHEAGQKLLALGGFAALLRYSIGWS